MEKRGKGIEFTRQNQQESIIQFALKCEFSIENINQWKTKLKKIHFHSFLGGK